MINFNNSEFSYLLEYTDLYKKTPNKYLREANILRLQVNHILQPPVNGEYVVGMIKHTFIGCSPQYGGKYMYFFNEEEANKYLLENKSILSEKQYQTICNTYSFWKNENMLAKLNDRFSKKHSHFDKYSLYKDHIGESLRYGVVGEPDGRLALTIPDIDKLLQNGIVGLREELEDLSEPYYQALDITLKSIEDAIDYYKYQVCSLLEQDRNNTILTQVYNSLGRIRYRKPTNFLEAVQLYWIYAVISDLMNPGRMDVYLGDFYANDIKTGVLTEEKTIQILTDLYKKYKTIGKIHDTRIIIGGLGRRNAKNADALAMVIMETSRRFKDVVPQLTIRCYSGMDKDLYNKALEVNAEGCSYPIIYSDDTVVPAIEKAYNVCHADALQYIPAGCGEYVLEAMSVGSPNSSVNLAKAIELVLHHGKDMYFNVQAGPDSGKLDSLKTFEDFWNAFTAQLDYAIPIVAWAEKDCYDIIAENSGCLYLSLLMKDCIERRKPLMEGGVRYVTGMTEVNGMITAADSLSAIKKLVYEQHKFTLNQLVNILDANYEGYAVERKMLQESPKYGNDNEEADKMAIRVYNYIADLCIRYTDIIGIDKYIMVSVNNSESAVWGNVTMASPCGRKNGEPLSNGDGPSIGADRNGASALLNSMRKFDHTKNAGVINNIRFTKSVFKNSYSKVSALLWAFLTHNGNQLNLMVIGRDDLINAKAHPEQYQNLIIRIGGFSARFVELDPIVQNEIIQRTTFES